MMTRVKSRFGDFDHITHGGRSSSDVDTDDDDDDTEEE